eukprot:COSAG02_NODE_772_length_17359_cov_74.661587_9_plen_206_part_00
MDLSPPMAPRPSANATLGVPELFAVLMVPCISKGNVHVAVNSGSVHYLSMTLRTVPPALRRDYWNWPPAINYCRCLDTLVSETHTLARVQIERNVESSVIALGRLSLSPSLDHDDAMLHRRGYCNSVGAIRMLARLPAQADTFGSQSSRGNIHAPCVRLDMCACIGAKIFTSPCHSRHPSLIFIYPCVPDKLPPSVIGSTDLTVF